MSLRHPVHINHMRRPLIFSCAHRLSLSLARPEYLCLIFCFLAGNVRYTWIMHVAFSPVFSLAHAGFFFSRSSCVFKFFFPWGNVRYTWIMCVFFPPLFSWVCKLFLSLVAHTSICLCCSMCAVCCTCAVVLAHQHTSRFRFLVGTQILSFFFCQSSLLSFFL